MNQDNTLAAALMTALMTALTTGPAAVADTIVQTGSIGQLGEVSIELEQFDTKGGLRTLDAVRIDVASTMHGGTTTSGSGIPVTLTITFEQRYELDGELLVGTECVFHSTFPNDAMIAYSFFVNDADSTSVADLEPWIGPGQITITSIGTFTVVADPPEEILDAGAGLGADYTVTYDYTTAASCPGDVDGDGVVDFGDLLDTLSGWGPCPGCPADVDGNDIVDFSDLLVVLSGWGPCDG